VEDSLGGVGAVADAWLVAWAVEAVGRIGRIMEQEVAACKQVVAEQLR